MADDFKNLTKEERSIIIKHLKFYQSLESGKRSPTTKAQKHFVDVCRGDATPKTIHEIAYAKFIGLYSTKNSPDKMNDNNSEWEMKLKALQNSLENNKIKYDGRFKKKSAQKKAFNPKKNPKAKKSEKSFQNTLAQYSYAIKSDQQIKTEILEKAKNRSGLAEYYEMKMSERQSEIPEYEEGYPKPDWFTDEDWKKMKRQDYADMKKHHRD
jgi:uncharacterized protein YifE (UPF0438 family)